ncbi:DNA polymerase [Thermosipho sp. 1063]|uniref:helix-hairpin-helix domain-containing protein n=1 Tax=unclassified Thermosipho (in: thermotogales) TaxID=2676525 RepID=UPI0009493254|nr:MULTISPECIES: DNA polymerase III subunit alpha [unclassified Thermosipho (in: thermotogales)]ANQ54377.1 DNA-directed DNA polymerase [Thermosipho sp. 1070]APT72822.1 DNA polymerase [Thermosipho sp. 1063]
MITAIVSPYSFKGSILKIEDTVRYASSQEAKVLVLCDNNFHATVKFIETCKKYHIKPIIAYPYNDKVFYAKNTDELYSLFNAYSNNSFQKLDLNYIDKDQVYFAYYLPGKRKVYETFSKFLGISPVEKGVLKKIYCNLDVSDYKITSFQTLPKAPSNFINLEKINNPAYKERLKYELEIIKAKNFLDYFYTVHKITNIAKKNNIKIGPGRGSAVGSLLSYMLGITKIDPLKYNLLFERFLNIGRKEPPDIDLDVEDEKRKKLIELLKEEFKYVYHISTFSNIGLKTLKKIAFETNVSYLELNDLLGLPIHKSIHAAGIIISTSPLELPIKDNIIEWDMDSLQKIGYIKFDILGLKTLTILSELENVLGKPKLDSETFKFISKGYTNGIFQLESNIAKKIIRLIKPKSINELSIVISLNRPGPLKSNLDKKLASAKWKNQKGKLDILDETYGILIFQEQIMKIAKNYAEFSDEEADILRKAVSKKDKNIMKPLMEKFRNNLLKKFSENEVNELVEIILEFSEYAFNKSHAVAYSHISYYLSYFKKHYPKEFYTILLKYDTSKIEKIIFEIQSRGFKISSPNIENRKDENTFYIPLFLIKGINENLERKILENSPYNSLEEFIQKNPNLNYSVIESLIKVGSFDYLSNNRRELLFKLKEIRNGINEKILELSNKLFGKKISEEIKEEKAWERCDMEYNTLGFCISKPFTDNELENQLAPLSIAFSRDQKLAINVKSIAGYASDGISTIKINIPDGIYTLIYDRELKIIPGYRKVTYSVNNLPPKNFLEKGNTNEYLYVKNNNLKIKGARPLFDDYKIMIEGERDVY